MITKSYIEYVFRPTSHVLARSEIALQLGFDSKDARLTDDFCQNYVDMYYSENCTAMDEDEMEEWIQENKFRD